MAKITVTSAGNKASVNATPDTAMYYSNKSREWAISDKIVDNEDYSSKYYAENSKESAELSGTYADNANGYLQDMTVNYTEYMENLTNSKNTALDEISTLNSSSLAEIETAKTGALTDIDTLHVDSVNDITNLKDTSLSEIETAKKNAISDITNQENLSVGANVGLDNLSEAGEKRFSDVWKIISCTYYGEDLTDKFANEISEYNSPWEWIQTRIQAGQFEGIRPFDYIPMIMQAGTCGGYAIPENQFKIQVAGINTFRNTQDQICGNHIDFIAEEVIDTKIPWQASDTNNGTASQPMSYLTSVVYAVLNGVNNYTTSAQGNKPHGVNASSKGIIHLLPQNLQNIIIPRRDLLDKRYSASAQLKYSTDWSWESMGKLFIPKETDVCGTQARSNLGYGEGYWNPENGLSAQYTIFVGQAQSRVKKNSEGARCHWWLASPASCNSTDVCFVAIYGNSGHPSATHSNICVPLCFRIG